MNSFWYQPLESSVGKRLSVAAPLKWHFDPEDAEKYHLQRKGERALLINDIFAEINLTGRSVCSLACGFAGEESLLVGHCKKLVLVEPDRKTVEWLRLKYGRSAEVIRLPYEYYEPIEKYGLIYSSSPSDWMNSDPFLGVKAELLEFARKNLEADGLFVALIYGGAHSGFILDKPHYIECLKRSIECAGLEVLLYSKYAESNAILVCGKESRVVPNLARWAADHTPTASSASPWGFPIDMAVNGWFLLRNVRVAASQFFKSLSQCWKMRSIRDSKNPEASAAAVVRANAHAAQSARGNIVQQ